MMNYTPLKANMTLEDEFSLPKKLPSLKLTAKAPENGWLEYYFPIGMTYF